MKFPSLSRGCEIAQFFVRYMARKAKGAVTASSTSVSVGTLAFDAPRKLTPAFADSSGNGKSLAGTIIA